MIYWSVVTIGTVWAGKWLWQSEHSRMHIRWKIHEVVDLFVNFLRDVRGISYWRSPLMVPLAVFEPLIELLWGLTIWIVTVTFAVFGWFMIFSFLGLWLSNETTVWMLEGLREWLFGPR